MAPLRLGGPLAAEPERLAGRRPGGHLQRHGAVGGRYLHARPQGRLRERDRDGQRQVGPLPPKQPVGRDPDHDEQVAGTTPRRSRLAPAGEADPCAVAHSGRDLRGEAAGPANAPRAVTRRTGRLHHAPRSAAIGAGAGEREGSLGHGDGSRAAALGAGDRRRSGSRARAVTGIARRGPLDLHGDRDALHGVLERDAHIRLEVGPLCRRPPTSTGRAEQPAQEIPEVADVGALEPLTEREALDADASTARAAWTSGPEATEPRGGHVAHLVVLLALLLVAQHFVGGRDVLEAILGLLVARVRIGVVLLGQLAVGLLDVRGRGVLGDAEDLVVVLLEPFPPDVAVHRVPLGLTSGRP